MRNIQALLMTVGFLAVTTDLKAGEAPLCQVSHPLGLSARSCCRLSWTDRTSRQVQCIEVWEAQQKLVNCVQTLSPFSIQSGLRRLDLYRLQVSEAIQDVDRSGVFRTLILGEKIDEESRPGIPPVYFVLRFLGFVHLLNATGIHCLALFRSWQRVGQVLGFVSGWGTRQQRWLRNTFRATGGLLCFWVWILSGLRAGMLRPLILLSLKAAAESLGLRWARMVTLGLGLLIDGLVAFFWSGSGVWAPGRWVYGLAVAGAVLVSWQKRTSHLKLALGSWVLTAWIEAFWDGWISWMTPIWSWLTTGWFCLFLYPALVLSLIFDSSFEFTRILIRWGSGFLDLVAGVSVKLSWIAWVRPEIALISILVAFLIFVFRRYYRIAICVLLFVALGLRYMPILHQGRNQIIQIDVGQGDSAWIRDHRFGDGLIDTGGTNVTYRRWFDFFARHQIARLNWVTLTHWDSDHAAGLEKLLRLIPIDCVAQSRSQWDEPRGLNWENLIRNQSVRVSDFRSGCLPFDVLESWNRSGRNQKMNLILVRLDSGAIYLNSGDADRAQEKRWLPMLKNWISRNSKGDQPVILKIGHHGSRTSSSPLWLKQIAPTEAWISLGVRNHYGHPNDEVIDELTKNRIPIRRTDQVGSIELKKQSATVNDQHVSGDPSRIGL